jgi:EmrB/QacA subfamily drug resistance transporter
MDRRWLGLGVICVAMFISAMDMTIVNVALPDMSDDLNAGIGELQWVLDAFLVSLAGMLLVGSGLADRFGRRRVFLAGFVGFAIASVLTAAAESVEAVIAARVLMGVAAACVLPPALALLAVIFPPELRPRALGIWSAVAGVGLALGPVVGGALVDLAGWQWVFLVNVPFVLVAAPLGLRWLPESYRPGTPPLDIPGVVLSTLALTGVVFALIEGVDTGWTSPVVLAAIAIGTGSLIAFVAVELRRDHPLFDVRVLARPRVGTGGLAILCAYISVLGMLFLLPQYLQYVQGASPFVSGAHLASFGVALGTFSALSGAQVARFGARAVLLAGLLGAAAGYVPLLFLSADSTPWLVTLGAGLVGCGMGLTFPPASGVIMNDLGLEKAGDGAAVNQLSRQVGGALGVAIVGSVFAAIYAARLPEGNPVAKESIEDARDVADTLGGAAGTGLIEEAVASFDVAARWGLAVCMGVLLLAALRVVVLQSRKGGSPTSGEPSTDLERSSVRAHS